MPDPVWRLEEIFFFFKLAIGAGGRGWEVDLWPPPPKAAAQSGQRQFVLPPSGGQPGSRAVCTGLGGLLGPFVRHWDKRGREHGWLVSSVGSYASGLYEPLCSHQTFACVCARTSRWPPFPMCVGYAGGSCRPDGWWSSSYGSQCLYGWPAPRRQTK